MQLSIFLIDLFVRTYRLSSHARLEAFVIQTKLSSHVLHLLPLTDISTSKLPHVCTTSDQSHFPHISFFAVHVVCCARGLERGPFLACLRTKIAASRVFLHTQSYFIHNGSVELAHTYCFCCARGLERGPPLSCLLAYQDSASHVFLHTQSYLIHIGPVKLAHTYIVFAACVVLKEAPFLLACVPRLLPHVYFYTLKVTSYTLDQSNLLTHILFCCVRGLERGPFLACLHTKIAASHVFSHTQSYFIHIGPVELAHTYIVFAARVVLAEAPFLLLAYQDCCLTKPVTFSHIRRSNFAHILNCSCSLQSLARSMQYSLQYKNSSCRWSLHSLASSLLCCNPLQYENRNLRFGVREHGMAAISNGIALHTPGLIPYAATFFNFTDYMRGAMRLSALSHAGVIYGTDSLL